MDASAAPGQADESTRTWAEQRVESLVSDQVNVWAQTAAQAKGKKGTVEPGGTPGRPRKCRLTGERYRGRIGGYSR
jgi:hypothetical protein